MAQILEKQLSTDSRAIPVGNRVQMQAASKAAARLARQLGFQSTECQEIALAVLELGSNLVKHAGQGEIQLEPLTQEKRVGIQIVSLDSGPGIPDAERALADGFSTAGGLGNGLGAVNRLMDSLEFYPSSPSGVRIVCRRWARPADSDFGTQRLEFGSATRSYRLLPENGDALVIRRWADHGLAGVIDGLGHGQFAQRAAQTARQYVEHHFDQPLASLFRGVGRACRTTRGVVMALARFDLAREKVAVASLGNVEVRLLGEIEPHSPVVRRGIVGLAAAPEPVIREYRWAPSSLLIMHSDGVVSSWTREPFPSPQQATAAAIAHRLLQKFGRADDDATVLVARSASP